MSDHARWHVYEIQMKSVTEVSSTFQYYKMPPAQGPRQPRHPSFPFLFAVIFPLFRLLFSLTPIAQPQDFNLLTPKSIDTLGDKPAALIVTAHPDDEVMFFSPTILNLIGVGWDVTGLCLSTGKPHSWTPVKTKAFSAGNSEDLGQSRKEEFIKGYAALGVPAENLEIIDHPYVTPSFRKSLLMVFQVTFQMA